MKKRDLILILGLCALAGLLLLVGLAQRGALAVPAGLSAAPSEAAETSAPPASETVRAAVAAFFDEYPAASYLVVTTANGVHLPVPLREENEFRLTQADGSENTVHIGRDSFYMAASNCDNQSCVQQGEVTLLNREARLLFNMVICLPHNLRLELLDRAETEALLTALYAEAEAAGFLSGEGAYAD